MIIGHSTLSMVAKMINPKPVICQRENDSSKNSHCQAEVNSKLVKINGAN